MKRKGEAERERERVREAGGSRGKEGGRGNTGTSHELNRTANSSTREGGGGGGRWGTDRFYITLRTHTHTQKKRDTSCISRQS